MVFIKILHLDLVKIVEKGAKYAQMPIVAKNALTLN